MPLKPQTAEHATALSRLIWEMRLTRTALAAALTPPVDSSTITRWANGERAIPDERVAQLAELLGVTEDEIRGRRAA